MRKGCAAEDNIRISPRVWMSRAHGLRRGSRERAKNAFHHALGRRAGTISAEGARAQEKIPRHPSNTHGLPRGPCLDGRIRAAPATLPEKDRRVETSGVW